MDETLVVALIAINIAGFILGMPLVLDGKTFATRATGMVLVCAGAMALCVLAVKP